MCDRPCLPSAPPFPRKGPPQTTEGQLPQFAVAPAIRFLGALVAPSDLYVLCMVLPLFCFWWLYLTAAVWCLPCLPSCRQGKGVGQLM